MLNTGGHSLSEKVTLVKVNNNNKSIMTPRLSQDNRWRLAQDGKADVFFNNGAFAASIFAGGFL